MQSLRHMALLLLVAVGSIVGHSGSALTQGDNPAIVVGSLSFSESAILAEMLSLLLEDAGYDVERKPDLGFTSEAHDSLVSGEIDLYVEYTGGGFVSVLSRPVSAADDGSGNATPASIVDGTFDIVAEVYLEEFGLVWLDQIGFNNTYAMAVTVDTAEAYDLVTVSDLAKRAAEMTLGTDQEFPDRQDGLPGLEAAYVIEFGEVRSGEPGQMYEAIATGDVDVIAACTTDGRLPGLDLVLLEDDLDFFPPYFAAPVVNGEWLENNPALVETLNRLASRIDEETMAGLNYLVDVEGESPIDVARAFFTDEGLIDSANAPETESG